ncbi:hypothetical protein V6N12_074171 [Hibiscus sabdariffa]|uniref:BRCA1-associated RING domain protein 1 n=1 Tax=Hibiscus sabdariffa TaxID=183260 RepID=A0ABR2BG15_9ROSI
MIFQSLGNYSAKGVGKRNFDDTTSQKQENSALGVDGNSWDSKSQKRLNYGQLDMVVNSLCENRAICGFCQSSRISEATGIMLHYLNGKPVTGDVSFSSNVIHVHSSCIEWAPQVYYVGDSVKNLKAELARGAKLKCSRCGLKGAALGCYVKSCRRSYHVPCALRNSKMSMGPCLYLLCMLIGGVATEAKLFETVYFLNWLLNCVESETDCSSSCSDQLKSNTFWGQPDDKKDWVFCGSALSPEEKFLLVKFAKMIGATVTKFWRPDVTHVIASTDGTGACTRTLKVLMAISSGKWVLNINWIKECMKAVHPLSEEPYEAPKLFDGFNFYFVGDFVSGYKEDLQNLVNTAGGTVLRRMEELIEHNNGGDQTIQTKMVVVVYNLDAPQGFELGEEVSIIWQRVSEAQDLATKIGATTEGEGGAYSPVTTYDAAITLFKAPSLATTHDVAITLPGASSPVTSHSLDAATALLHLGDKASPPATIPLHPHRSTPSKYPRFPPDFAGIDLPSPVHRRSVWMDLTLHLTPPTSPRVPPPADYLSCFVHRRDKTPRVVVLTSTREEAWTEYEDGILLAGFEKHGNDWRQDDGGIVLSEEKKGRLTLKGNDIDASPPPPHATAPPPPLGATTLFLREGGAIV